MSTTSVRTALAASRSTRLGSIPRGCSAFAAPRTSPRRSRGRRLRPNPGVDLRAGARRDDSRHGDQGEKRPRRSDDAADPPPGGSGEHRLELGAKVLLELGDFASARRIGREERFRQPATPSFTLWSSTAGRARRARPTLPPLVQDDWRPRQVDLRDPRWIRRASSRPLISRTRRPISS